MKTPLKLAGFAAMLAGTLAISFGIGRAVGPVGDTADDHHTADDSTASAATEAPGGLMTSRAGYTLQLDSPILPARDTTVAFRVTGPQGQPVTDYTTSHDEDLHLIAVRRDLTGYQHVHPTMDAAGTWSTNLDLTPGTWRLFADFRPAALDQAVTLGIDASVAGTYDPQPLPVADTTTEIDGYRVTIAGDLIAGTPSDVTFTVTRDGQPMTDLQPYLGAYGHLVALRAGDLAYLHVHPAGTLDDGTTRSGPDVGFGATAPSAGSYRLFLDFQHEGVVHTAEFTVETTAAGASPTADAHETGSHDAREHD